MQITTLIITCRGVLSLAGIASLHSLCVCTAQSFHLFWLIVVCVLVQCITVVLDGVSAHPLV